MDRDPLTAMPLLAFLIFLSSALASVSAQAQRGSLALDRAVFEAVVRETADSIPEVLLVDVRPLRPGVDLTGLDPEDVDRGDTGSAAARASVLQRLGIGGTDALAELGCLWTRGVQAPPRPHARPLPDSLLRVHQACLARPAFAVLMTGRPEPLAGRDGGVRVRVLRFSTYAYGYWDYTLRCGSSGRWTVVERKRYLNVMS
jgi:hypothetical protein